MLLVEVLTTSALFTTSQLEKDLLGLRVSSLDTVVTCLAADFSTTVASSHLLAT